MKILVWYTKNKRDLPWRHPSLKLRNGLRDPYKILISEVMAQQTQLSRVVPKYLEWMQAFPTLQDLAKASTWDVLFHWSGLGYNRRALYLKKVAEELVNMEKTSPQSSPFRRGRSRLSNLYWPKTEKELRKLPGIGEYTAKAILCFAFNQQVAVVDTNVKKVIMTKFSSVIPDLIRNPEKRNGSRTTIRDDKRDLTNKEIQEIADQLLPKGKAYEWNQALMDYAAMELKHHPSTTLKVNKIPFKDSDRYYRGLTIRLLLKKNKQSLKDLFATVTKDHFITEKRYKNILTQLRKDGLIEEKQKKFLLKEE